MTFRPQQTAIWLSLIAAFLTAPAIAQSSPAFVPPKTAFGYPDLQGVWTNQSITGLTRPPGVASLVVSDGETEREAQAELHPNCTPIAPFCTPIAPHCTLSRSWVYSWGAFYDVRSGKRDLTVC